MNKEFHHVGMPTTEKQPDEIYISDMDLYITDASQHDHKVEWVRFGPKCTLPKVLSQRGHVAFAVSNLDEAIKGQKVIVPPCDPVPGLRIAFILDGNAPIEYLEFK